jgi:peptide chain release factor
MTSVAVCITSGRGPVECQLAVSHVATVFIREAGELGLNISHEKTVQACASFVIVVDGTSADLFVRSWEGTILWRAESNLRSGHARKNWYIAVTRLAEPVQMPHILDQDLRFETLRAGGPGGQHQNTTESAVRVVHIPSGASAIARDERSQHRNKQRAIERLRDVLSARRDLQAAAGAAADWVKRISIERGNPVRVYVGERFVRLKQDE